MNQIREEIEVNGMDPERLQFSNVYIPYFRGLADKFRKFNSKIESLT
jgi:heterodisulfide reductase subunit A